MSSKIHLQLFEYPANRQRDRPTHKGKNIPSPSFHFNGHFSRWTWVIQYQNVSILDFIGAKDDGGGGDNWNYKTYKAPVKSSPPTNQHSVFFVLDALPVVQLTCQSTEGK